MNLINKDRQQFGAASLSLGSNSAAQAHAEDMLDKGFRSHWSWDGQKPYMRYTKAGGMGYVTENVFALPNAVDPATSPAKDAYQLLQDAEKSLMADAASRSAILDKWHKQVSLGVAYNGAALALVQDFEGSYVSYSQPPSLNSGVLALSGQTLDGFVFDSLQVWYEPWPTPLSLGQLNASACYDIGSLAGIIREPGSYSDTETNASWQRCPDPRSFPTATAPPSPSTDQSGIPSHGAAAVETVQGVVSYVNAGSWEVDKSAFSIIASLRPVLSKRGVGVYTVVLWGKKGNETLHLTNLSFWHDGTLG